MALKLSKDQFETAFSGLAERFTIYGPKRFPKQGRYVDTDVIKYAVLTSPADLVYDQKSTYPAKEVITPITETLLYFSDDEYREKKSAVKPLLVFARACDINAFKRTDCIYLQNGGFSDLYYQRTREQIHFALMECPEKGWDTCFCASINGNQTNRDEYLFGIQFNDECIKIDPVSSVCDAIFQGEQIDYQVPTVTENVRQVNLPRIPNKAVQQQVKSLDLWQSYDERCLRCGSCTVACPTCTCYTAYDLLYTTDSNAGERRRIAASCHIDGYTDMAGGHTFRKSTGERMRFKTLHKVYDFQKRFGGDHMCVGCGRCDDRCPVFISFSTLVNKLAAETEKLNGGADHE